MRDKIKLVSSEGTGHFYTTTKNKKTMPEKMEIKKFDPVVRRYVIYKEAKIKLSPIRLAGVINLRLALTVSQFFAVLSSAFRVSTCLASEEHCCSKAFFSASTILQWVFNF